MENRPIPMCKMLADRQLGNLLHINLPKKITELNVEAALLSENFLIEEKKLDTFSAKILLGDDSAARSTFLIKFNKQGTVAAAVHSNRTISIIDTVSMQVTRSISSFQRSVWALAFHPADTSIFAGGDLGGNVIVFNNFISSRYFFSSNKAVVASVCFHDTETYLFMAIENSVLIWNWLTNSIVHRIAAIQTIRFVDYLPQSKLLLIGIKNNNEISLDHLARNNFEMMAFAINYLLKIFENITVIPIVERLKETKRVWEFIELRLNDTSNMFNWDETENVQLSLNLFARRLDEIKEDLDKFQKLNETFILKEAYENRSNIEINLNNRLNYLKTLGNIPAKYFYTFQIILLRIVFLVKNDISLEWWEAQKSNSDLDHHLIAWSFDLDNFADLRKEWKNVITSCSIHNDASIAISEELQKMAVYRKMRNFGNIIEIRSLNINSLGSLISKYEAVNSLVSLSLSPSSIHLLVGTRSKLSRLNGQFVIAIVLKDVGAPYLRCIAEITFDHEINCIVWAKRPGDGIMIGNLNSSLTLMR